MKKIILVEGATGNLGARIINALLDRGAEVRAVVRSGGVPLKNNLTVLNYVKFEEY